jgi:hypothetical protein
MVLAPLEPWVGEGRAPPAISMAQGTSPDGGSPGLSAGGSLFEKWSHRPTRSR